jgi:S1-C subfamily serine protease
MKTKLLFVLLFVFGNIYSQDTVITNKSREATLKIIAFDNGSKVVNIGTGFFVQAYNEIFVVTCLHVVTEFVTDKNNLSFRQTFDFIKGITWNNDTIDLQLTSEHAGVIPIDYEIHDYGILKCFQKPKNIELLTMALNDKNIFVGENIRFSGYPFNFPCMLTHTGTISGTAKNDTIIYIQSSINGGNSGGALLDDKGEVIGIIDFKIGGLSQALEEQKEKLTSLNSFSEVQNHSSHGGMVTVDSPHLTLELYNMLDENITTGIGVAINIKYVRKNLFK